MKALTAMDGSTGCRCLKIILTIHIHPCYLIRLFKSGIDTEDFYDYIKMLFPNKCMQNMDPAARQKRLPDILQVDQLTGQKRRLQFDLSLVSIEKERVNFILINLLKGCIKKDFEKYEKIEQVKFTAPESLVGRIFYKVMCS